MGIYMHLYIPRFNSSTPQPFFDTIVTQRLCPCMSHLTEIIYRCIYLTSLKMRMCRTPDAEVDYWTDTARLQELLSVRPHISNRRYEIVPCISKASFLQVIDTFGMPKRGAEAKEAIIAYREAAVARTAVKEVVTFYSCKFRYDELITAFL